MTIYAKIYLLFIIIMSIITFIMYAIDKKQSQKKQKNKKRISEILLLSLSIFGGAIGGYLGMTIYHHKTNHWYFMLTNILGVVLDTIIFMLLLK